MAIDALFTSRIILERDGRSDIPLSPYPPVVLDDSTWLDISEWSLLLFGIVLVIGLAGEYRSKRYEKEFAMVVIIGVFGELLADGGIFLFSDRLLSAQGLAITGLTDQLKTTQTTLCKAVADNAVLLAIQQSQSREIERLRNKHSGPFTWSVSVVFPYIDMPPNSTAGAYNIGRFTPDTDITVRSSRQD